MKLHARSLTRCLAVTLCFWAPSVFAGSDTAFCTAPGYLAYEVRTGITAGVAGQMLRVVRFEPPHGIYLVGDVKLKDFQPQRMICSKDRLEISGWGKEFHKYIIEIAPPDRVRILEHTEDAKRRLDPTTKAPEPLQLSYSKPQSVALESTDLEHTYELRISEEQKRARGRLQHRHRAELVQLDKKGKVEQHVVLYEREWLETAD